MSCDIKVRYADENDLDFVLEGNIEIRKLTNYLNPDIKISRRPAILKAIQKKEIRIMEVQSEIAGFYLAIMNHTVMGFEKTFWVDMIYIKEKFRGKGLIKRLYEDIFNSAKKNGFKEVFLDVFEHNKKSIAVHKKIGFEPLCAIYHKKI